MKQVHDLLQFKETAIWSVPPTATVLEAIRVLSEKDVGAVLVMQDGRVVGIFSERDYARKIILAGKASKDTPVREVMTERVVFVRPDQSLEDCMALMTKKRIRHLPVMEGEKLLGIISIGDVVRAVIDEKDFVIGQLEHYITGGTLAN